MKTATHTTAVLLALLIALLAGSSQAAAAGPKTTRVSVGSNGQGGPYESDFPSLSANGRYSCFESLNKFTKGDAKIDDDVFVHDRVTGTTTRVSVKSNGKEAPGAANSDSCSLSADGRLVAFRSDAPLANGATYGGIYVHDMSTGETTLVSVKSNGDQLNASEANPRISANGRYVVWDTDGAFSAADVNGYTDVYRHDLKTGKTQQVSLRSGGSQPVYESSEPSISADGQRIAFQSDDGHMTSDTDYQFLIDTDVFVRDMKQGTTVRASLSSNGDEPTYPNHTGPANVSSNHPVISADGKFVAFHSFGIYNGSDDNPNYGDVFLHNLSTGKTSLVSLKSNGQQATGESGYTDPHPIEISDDGRFVAFDSEAQLSAKDTDNVGDVYVRDRQTNKTQLASVKSNGQPLGNVDAALPALSSDGKWVAFASSDPYVGNDDNNDSDIYERGPLN